MTKASIIRSTKNLGHLGFAILANLRYGFPSRRLTVIGVTGTDGKTTTSHLIYHILKSAGKKVSISTSIFADVAGETTDTGLHVTTQSYWDVQKNLRKAAKKGDKYFVLETTSHGIDQKRIWGVSYKVAVLTNITPEHLDYHKTYAHYLKTKVKLLLAAKHAVINKDDQSYDKVKAILDKVGHPYTTYSLREDADIVWTKNIRTHLKEEFNKENILAAIGACKKLGLSEETILSGIKTFKLPKGRLDTVFDGRFRVIIDFAHTPNSIRRLLGNFDDLSEGRIIHVFGSAGLRDNQKRPDMGRASGEHADLVILTEEDYRTEEFTDITQAISQGLFENGFTYVEPHQLGTVKKGDKQFAIIKNRQKAIDTALDIAHKDDVILITGKGHEQSLARGTKEYPWDDYKAVRKAL
jgi:UDP-N-acetylmuramoyl-L-alanyl-D-glutamate--2,6-diaminopimelate ligase